MSLGLCGLKFTISVLNFWNCQTFEMCPKLSLFPPIFCKRLTELESLQNKLSFAINICLNCDHKKTFVSTDQAGFHTELLGQVIAIKLWKCKLIECHSRWHMKPQRLVSTTNILLHQFDLATESSLPKSQVDLTSNLVILSPYKPLTQFQYKWGLDLGYFSWLPKTYF